MTETIACQPDDLLAFVMDPERYAQVDSKIRPVLSVRRMGNVTEFKFRPRVACIPGPPAISQMTLTPGTRVDVALAPPPANRLARLASDFTASFVCTPVEGGTELVRTLNYDFRPPFGWLARRLLRRRMTAEVHDEVRLAKQHLERSS